jgi:hypothetical protein
MVQDFGGHAAPRWRKGQRYAYLRLAVGKSVLLGALLIIAVLPIAMPASIDAAAGASANRHDPVGKPCPRISEADFYRGWTEEPHVFAFSGVSFARRRGDADCHAEKHGLLGMMGAIYPTCRFDQPYQLAVTAGGRTAYYAVPQSYTALVEAPPAGPRCRVSRPYDMYTLKG